LPKNHERGESGENLTIELWNQGVVGYREFVVACARSRGDDCHAAASRRHERELQP
jgi:hypothetical protein